MSMGGYGALLLALRNPKMFVSAVSHAGGVSWARAHDQVPYVERQKQTREWERIVGVNACGGPHDLWALAEKLAPERRPALRLDCGTEDFLLEINRSLAAQLERVGYPHEYVEPPGAHNAQYMDARIRETVLFHARHLFA
jgi:S-formylglutathione hydrolase FrmB